jgi:hypothetical protein
MQVFRDLIQAHPTSAGLEAFLESEEGGRLRVVREGALCLIRYEKGLSDFSKAHVPWFRSVVWDTVANRPLSVAPPRKVRRHEEGAEDAAWEVEWRVQPLLDGVMVNVYRTAEGWGMATRSRLGASGYFYSSKPFSQLFQEALGVADLEAWGMALQGPKGAAETAVFYSFLLQHSENRNVTPIHRNAVYLIHRGAVGVDGSLTWDDFPTELPQATLAVEQAEPPMALSWTDQGQVWRDGKGGRVVDRRAAWQRVKEMRGNDASDIARFLRLYHAGVLAEYVGYYPEEEPFMRHHVQWMHRITRELFATYRAMYVRRCVTKEGVDRMWWPHVHQLQMIFQKSRRALTIIDAADYLRLAPWHRVAHLIRKGQAGAVQADEEEDSA